MKVSVVIPAFNASSFIRRTLDSVLAQTHPPSDVIVVDDGSVDGTAQVAASAGRPVTVVAGPRRGVSAARNEGVRRARGEAIAFLDHDDLWEPEKLRRQVQVLESSPEVGLVFTQVRIVRSDATGNLGDGILAGEEIFPVLSDPQAFLAQAYENLVHDNYIPMSAVMVRRESLPNASEEGPFNPRFRLSEDWDLWLRIAACHRIAFIPEPLARYVIMPERATNRMADLRIEDLEIFREQLRRSPWLASSDPRRCRETQRRLHDEAAYWLLREGRRTEARRNLLAAWRLRPSGLRPLWKLAASFFRSPRAAMG